MVLQCINGVGSNTVEVARFVYNTIEVHKSVMTPVGSLKSRLNEWIVT
jgi:hypothetical protein